ncbi:MAG: L,D-transpeptidase, partial [Clostridia bacterium]|nr:L,D-transpeptidase [Clostridia bacterium]
MKVYRLVAVLLIVALLTVGASAAPLLPYAIEVNRAANTVTVYSPDETGAYTVPVKAMICSTARQGYTTPAGTFRLAEFRSEWRLMLDGTYGQYATCFMGNYLFHSICYSDDSHDA